MTLSKFGVLYQVPKQFKKTTKARKVDLGDISKIHSSYSEMNQCQLITKWSQIISIPTTTNIIPDVNQSLFPNGRFKVPYNGLCVGAPQAPWLTHTGRFQSHTHILAVLLCLNNAACCPHKKTRGNNEMKNVPLGTV